MLPDFLSSSCKRYKDDMNVFATWLSKAATACGWKPRSLDQVKSSKTPASEVFVAKQPKLKGKVRKLAEEAAAKYTNTGVENRYSDAGHLHFIGILEQALEILGQSSTSSDTSAQGVVSAATPHDVLADLICGLSNRFGILNIEEPAELAALVTEEVQAVTKNIPSKALANEVYGLEIDDVIDVAFDVFCFLEDLHYTQEYLADLWKTWGAGKVDLTSAAMTTNAALEISRCAEGIVALDRGSFTKPKSYQRIAGVILYEKSLARGGDFEEEEKSTEKLKITPLHELMYLPTYRTLATLTQFMALPHYIAYPQPTTACRFSFISRPELLETPTVKKWVRKIDYSHSC